MKNKNIYIIGLVITLVYLIFHLFLMKDYGLSWDYHYHHYAGLFHLGLPVPSINDMPPVPFSPPDPRLTTQDPFGPFTQIIPSLSQVIFHDRLNILPFDIAYNLPMVLLGSLGVGLLFVFLAISLGRKQGYFGAFFLAFLPNYFAYLHNNMKDIPNAFAFTLSLFSFWLLVNKKTLFSLLVAVISFAVAFNIKINSIMIPVVCLIWLILYKGMEYLLIIRQGWKKIKDTRIYLILSYFLLTPFAAMFVWWPFWKNPMAKLLELPYFYSHNTINMPVLLLGKMYLSGVNIPAFYPYLYLLITTQVPILICFIAGLFISLFRFRKNNGIYSLVLIWFIVPLLRYLSPTGGAIDGVRHFMEVVFPLCFIAGIGAFEIIKKIIMNTKLKIINSSIITLGVIIIIYPIYFYHPYQTSYFNIFIGGIKGAEGKFDIDFWGTPQKEAVNWLNMNASLNSSVYIVMAQSTAGAYIRDDLRSKLNTGSINNSDYIVILNRQSMFDSYNLKDFIKEKIASRKIVYKKEIDGVSLVWVFRK
jgi:hypothetical protein